MSVKIRIYKNTNSKSEFYGKVYGRVVAGDELSTAEIAQRIEASCTLTEEDVAACIKAFIKQIRTGLQDGKRVVLDGLGAFKVTVKSAPADKEEDFSVKKHIKSVRVLFQPEQRLRNGKRQTALLDGVKLNELLDYTYTPKKKAKGSEMQTNP